VRPNTAAAAAMRSFQFVSFMLFQSFILVDVFLSRAARRRPPAGVRFVRDVTTELDFLFLQENFRN
jgi:hypothetical protein